MVWADRMGTDIDFAKQWVLCIKSLFEIEDVNNDGVLQRDEFNKFSRSAISVMVPLNKIARETTTEKLNIHWNAMKCMSPGEVVTWNDFVKVYQIVELWIHSGKLLADLEETG